MITDFFVTLIAQAQDSATLSSRQKHDVIVLLEALGEALEQPDGLSRRDPEAAQAVRNFLACAIFESARRNRTSPLASAARKGMLLAFRPHEETHPHLTTLAYALGDVLAGLGV